MGGRARLAEKGRRPTLPHTLSQNRPDTPFRLAVGSFIEDYGNRIDIVSRE